VYKIYMIDRAVFFLNDDSLCSDTIVVPTDPWLDRVQ